MPLDVLVILPVARIVRPPAHPLLQTVDSKGRDGDHEGGTDSGRNPVPGMLEARGQQQTDYGICHRDGEDAPAAEFLPAEVHEQGHGTDGGESAKVVEDVGEIENRSGAGLALQIVVKCLGLLGGKDAVDGCLLQL